MPDNTNTNPQNTEEGEWVDPTKQVFEDTEKRAQEEDKANQKAQKQQDKQAQEQPKS